MRQLNGVYAQCYKAILIEKEAHLLELSRYIVRNPVAAGMVKLAEDWPWRSYRSTAGWSKHQALAVLTGYWNNLAEAHCVTGNMLNRH